jgi:hypothetical protein
VPEGITVIGNGNLLSTKTKRGRTTWHWYEDSSMAPYLATVTNGVFELRVLRHGVLELYQAVDPKLSQANWDQLSREGEIIDFFSELYGPYPFSSGGGVVDDRNVGYALESQTKSMYDTVANPSTVVHEVSHQWFGNAVTLTLCPTSGSTRVSRASRSGSTTSATAARPRRPRSSGFTRARRRPRAGASRPRRCPGRR